MFLFTLKLQKFYLYVKTIRLEKRKGRRLSLRPNTDTSFVSNFTIILELFNTISDQ
jgi:hypothetical protein